LPKIAQISETCAFWFDPVEPGVTPSLGASGTVAECVFREMGGGEFRRRNRCVEWRYFAPERLRSGDVEQCETSEHSALCAKCGNKQVDPACSLVAFICRIARPRMNALAWMRGYRRFDPAPRLEIAVKGAQRTAIDGGD
jgi:hypothetical protein